MFQAPNVHFVDLTDPFQGRSGGGIFIPTIAEIPEGNIGEVEARLFRGMLVGRGQGSGIVKGVTCFAVPQNPDEGDARVLPLSTEDAPKLVKGGRILLNASVGEEDGVVVLTRRKHKDGTHLVHVRTGIYRPAHLTRELALENFLEAGRFPLPHGSCPARRGELTPVVGVHDPMPKRVYRFAQERLRADGQTIMFQLDEVWEIPEGCTLVSCSLSLLPGVPHVLRLSVRRNHVVVELGTNDDYDFFLESSGITNVHRHVA